MWKQLRREKQTRHAERCLLVLAKPSRVMAIYLVDVSKREKYNGTSAGFVCKRVIVRKMILQRKVCVCACGSVCVRPRVCMKPPHSFFRTQNRYKTRGEFLTLLA